MSFDQAFSLTVSPAVEGGYTNNPSDPGGATKYGISQSAYPSLDIANLTLVQAQAIYLRDYWDACHCSSLPACIAGLVFDAAVNQGADWARRALQSAVGASTDGVIGPKTLAAVSAADVATLHATIGWLREARYRSLADFTTFGHGWIIRLCRVIAATASFT
jgi:lysozyme family protein